MASIVVFDSDANPPDGTAEDDFFKWQRPGVPQGQHGHVFRGRVGRVLREEAPDVVDAMLVHGIPTAGFDFGEGFENDFALMARRPVFEAVVRRRVRKEPGVEVRTGVRISGLAGAPLMQTKDPRSALAALAAQGDQQTASAFYRVDNLLSELSTVLSDSALQGRVNDYLAAVEQGPAGPGPLPRAQFESLLH